MRRVVLLALCCLLASAVAEEQRQLDPMKPADAVVIIDALTQDLALPRRQADAFRVALETLARHVQATTPAAPPAAATATPPPAPKKD